MTKMFAVTTYVLVKKTHYIELDEEDLDVDESARDRYLIEKGEYQTDEDLSGTGFRVESINSSTVTKLW